MSNNEGWQRVEPRVSRLHLGHDYRPNFILDYLSQNDEPGNWDLDELQVYADKRINDLLPEGYSFESFGSALNLPAPTDGQGWVPLALDVNESQHHEARSVFDQAYHDALVEATAKADNGEAPQFRLNPTRKES